MRLFLFAKGNMTAHCNACWKSEGYKVLCLNIRRGFGSTYLEIKEWLYSSIFNNKRDLIKTFKFSIVDVFVYRYRESVHTTLRDSDARKTTDHPCNNNDSIKYRVLQGRNQREQETCSQKGESLTQLF